LNEAIVTENHGFDVFVSYSRRRDLYQARLLADFLRSKGYHVWFDEWILQRKVSWVPQEKEELIALLRNAIRRSRCVVLFAIEAEGIHPSVDLERALFTKQAMRQHGTGLPIAWNWQVFELNAAADAMVLYPGKWSYDSLVEALRRRGVSPFRRSMRDRLSPVRRAIRWLTRRNRVRRQFRQLKQLPQPEIPETELQLIGFTVDTSKTGVIALVGDHGSGRTTIAKAIMPRLKRYHTITAALPASDDIKAWCSRMKKLPARSLVLIDDFGDALLALPWQEWPELLHAIGWCSDNRRVLLMMTAEQAEEWYKSGGREGEILFGRLPAETRRIRQPDVRDLCRIAEAALSRWVPSGVVWRTSLWSLAGLAESLQEIPVARSLRPLSRSTLQGTLLENPAKLLRVLEEIVALARANGNSEAVAITDETIAHVLRKVTGLSGVVPSHDREPDIAVQELCTSLGIQYSHDLRREITRVRMLSWPWSTWILAVGEKALRRGLAARLAELLYGSREAVLLLDYETKGEQILAPGSGCTEALSWILKAVKRFPFWVVCLERLDLAPLEDVAMIRRLADKKGLGYSIQKEARMLQRYCLILGDAPDVPRASDWSVAELKPVQT
jgi:TIR domain-containing protein